MRACLLVLLVLLAVPAIAAAAPPRTTLPDVEDEVMCPVCGVPLELAEAPQADRQREFIRSLIAQGATKEQVKRRLVDQYGPGVIAEPRREGFEATAWLVPLGLGAAALAGVGWALVRWRRRPRVPLPAPAPLSTADARRLDDDLARHDG
jgi:cytochrome c-type biogenesis protein CcmH/NrfF